VVKAGFFNKLNNVKDEETQLDKEVESKKDDVIMIDRNITKYIIDNFSDIGFDIRDSLINLTDTLENTIDYIEDRSSIVIKDSRNFKLSQDYRDKSIKIYQVVEKIKDYVSWIEESYNEKNSKQETSYKEQEEVIEKNKEKLPMNQICITEDFTSKSPKAFKIDNYYVEVSDWKELTVKAADILTKNYKNNKNNKKNDEIYADNVVLKESIENDFRDSVIDILKIYNVPLNKFYIYVE